MQGYKGGAIQHIDSNQICFPSGNNIKSVNIHNSEEKVFQGPGNGVSKIATLPSSGVFALTERGLNPRIFVCQFPSMKVIATLTGKLFVLRCTICWLRCQNLLLIEVDAVINNNVGKV